jgi:hypothetical protein
MDEKRLTASLRDEVGLAIEAAMAVEPAPELKVNVRARVDRERASASRWMPWQLASVAVALPLIGVAIGVWWPRETGRSVPTPAVAAVHVRAMAPLMAAAVPSSPRIDAPVRVGRSAPSASSQAAALRAYIDHFRHTPIDTSVVAARASDKPVNVAMITIERIAIEPLPKLEAITGERQ